MAAVHRFKKVHSPTELGELDQEFNEKEVQQLQQLAKVGRTVFSAQKREQSLVYDFSRIWVVHISKKHR